MIKRKGSVMLFILFISAVIISGCMCTDSSEDPVLTDSTEGISGSVSPVQSTTPPGTFLQNNQRTPWPDISPPYDEKTKNLMVDLAKEEIKRIFPDVDETTLKGRWEEDLKDYIPPDIIFDNVNATSEKHIFTALKRTNGHLKSGDPSLNNIVEIKVDSGTGMITSYKPAVYVVPSHDETLISFEDAEKKSLEFVKKVKGEEFIDEFGSGLFTEKGDEGRGVAYFAGRYSYKGVAYLTDGLCVRYDQGEDRVIYYSDSSKHYQLMKELTTASPEPSVSFDEAKRVFEEKISGEFPGEDFGISYISYGPELTWDIPQPVSTESPEPLKLVWNIYFNDEDMRKVDSRSITAARIDAHTGEILALTYRGITIPEYTEEEMERVVRVQQD